MNLNVNIPIELNDLAHQLSKEADIYDILLAFDQATQSIDFILAVLKYGLGESRDSIRNQECSFEDLIEELNTMDKQFIKQLASEIE